jgi:hypothetical protein
MRDTARVTALSAQGYTEKVLFRIFGYLDPGMNGVAYARMKLGTSIYTTLAPVTLILIEGDGLKTLAHSFSLQTKDAHSAP